MGDIRFDPTFTFGHLLQAVILVASIIGMVFWFGNQTSAYQSNLDAINADRVRYIPQLEELIRKDAASAVLITELTNAVKESRADVRMLLQETARIRERLAAIEVILNKREAQKEAKVETPPR